MELLGLAFGLTTALIGAYMVGIVLRTGNPRATATRSRLPTWVMLSHALVAAAGLVLWMIYMGYDGAAFAWSSLAFLVLASAGGGWMFLRWTLDRHGEADAVERRRSELSEQQIPSAAVHAHGALAFVTMVLILLTALGIAG